MRKWQYWQGVCQPGAHVEILDGLGPQGWELVSTTIVKAKLSPVIDGPEIDALLMIFKRPVEESGIVGPTEGLMSAPASNGHWGHEDRLTGNLNADARREP